jgi:hypothetical protein
MESDNLTVRLADDFPELRSWCLDGHEGRLCSRCSNDYFASGSACSKCLLANWKWLPVGLFSLGVMLFAAYTYSQVNPDSTPTANSESAAVRILLFHGQQLGLLFSTQAVFPGGFFSSFISTASSVSSFSPPSLATLECLLPSLSSNLLLAFCVPGALGLVGAIAKTLLWCLGAVNSWKSHLLRLVALSISLLNLTLLGTAQVSLAALGCTDNRQEQQSYLSLFPYMPCDSTWRSTILPLAAVSSLVWVVAFPAAVVWFLYRYSDRLSHDDDILVRLSGDMIRCYKPGFSWFFAVAMGRRLVLVAVIALIPYYSPYVPLCFVMVVQLSALIQHRLMPFKHAFGTLSFLSVPPYMPYPCL